MFTSDKKILHLIDVLIFEKKIKNPSEFCDTIGMLRQTLTKIKNGKQHFTPPYIELICKTYTVNANWIFGLNPNIFQNHNSYTKEEKINI
jgi:hypothetical protein